VKLKLKNLLNNSGTETVCKADEKYDVLMLDKREVTYCTLPNRSMSSWTVNTTSSKSKRIQGDAVHYIDDGMPCEVTFYEGRAISVEMPNSVVREVEYTEPAVKGDTSGKVMKPARIKPTGFELPVPAFVEIGDKIEIDTRTGEYRSRVKG
jgi:elongation factor P